VTRQVVDLEAAIDAAAAALSQRYDGDLGSKEEVAHVARTAVEAAAGVLGLVDMPRGAQRPDYIPSALTDEVLAREDYL
jgi:hypothetical protein